MLSEHHKLVRVKERIGWPLIWQFAELLGDNCRAGNSIWKVEKSQGTTNRIRDECVHYHVVFFAKHFLHKGGLAIKPGFEQLLVLPRVLNSSRFLAKRVF